jgi:hypothetical protein
MDYAFLAVLALWMICSLLRFVHMYQPSSPLHRWRRWDLFNLVPVGAFFGPRPPPMEYWILIRDVLPGGPEGLWTEVCRVRARTVWHALWNPDKHEYKGKLSAARSLMRQVPGGYSLGVEWPDRLALSEPYLALLQFVSTLPRLAKPAAVQFLVIETDILTGVAQGALLSRVHEL